MCGLVGIISRRAGGFYNDDLNLMQNLLLLDTIRGEDSTGVFTVMGDKNVAITKIGSHPMHLFATTAWSKMRGKAIAQGRIMIGHNRKATTGAVNSENAHPFHENNIVLVHNGTLKEDHKKIADTEVDSHAVAHAFAKNGAEATLATLNAAFAFIWWDIEKSRLYAVRNDDRPLSIVITDDLNILCSESWMAEALLARAGKKVEKVLDIPPGRLFEFNLDGTFNSKEIELRKPTVHTNIHQGNWVHRGRERDAFADMEDLDSGKTGGSTVITGMGTTQTPFNSAACALVAASGGTAVTRPFFAASDDFKRGDEVMVLVTAVDQNLTEAKWKLSGTVQEPGKPPLDVVGYLPTGTAKEVADKLLNTHTFVKIISLTASVCGMSAWVTGFTPVDMVKLHNTDIPLCTWNYVVAHSHCKDCGNGLHEQDRNFTSVTRRSNTEYRVTCADCIETKLTGEMKNVFIQRRLDALPDSQPVVQKPASSPLVVVETKGAQTLH